MKTVEARELKSMMSKDGRGVLIDTLPRESFEKEHIPGAKHIPAKDPNFVDRVDQTVKNRNDPVIVYCANKECDLSPNAAKELQEAGFSNVLDFEGGIEAWKKAGFEVTSGRPAQRT